jgi:hypothetical protein
MEDGCRMKAVETLALATAAMALAMEDMDQSA